ncbi:MAG: PAS domain-containing protein [Deltaproteobacteria bacterium]|nr:PAS domain-containing protein [Nannocystaceae bacterium]
MNTDVAPIESTTRTQAPQALDDLPDGVVSLSLAGIIEGVNHAFLRMTGRTSAEILHQRLDTLVAEEDMMCLIGFQAMFGDARVEDACVIFTAPDGARRPLIVCSTKSRDGLRVLMTTRAPGTLQRELASTSRWAADEQDRAHALSAARDALAEKNDALRVAQAELGRAYGALQDEMKTRERLEHELRLAQKLEAIGQLAAGVAHEINTPMQYVGDNIEFLGRVLAGVTGYLTAIHEAIGGEATGSLAELRSSIAATQKKSRIDYLMREAPKALRAAQDGIVHVSNIVRAMKSFAHVDSDDMTGADLNRAISDTLIVAQNEYKSVATVETELGQLPEVVCFVGKLSQVFLNLVVNAAHAIADAKRDTPGLIKVTSRQVDDCVEVTVSDNGCGISEANRHRVFDQFFTTKEVGRGTGQGLSLARRIVMESHGGTLSLESELGVGTSFCVRLPIAGRVASAAA